MCVYDTLNHFIQENQNYSVFGYLPYAFAAIHFQMAAVLTQKIKYPTAHADVSYIREYIFFVTRSSFLLHSKQMRAKRGKNASIITTMFQDLKADVRATNCRDTIVQDIIPYIIPIITPTLRPVCVTFLPCHRNWWILLIIYISLFLGECTVVQCGRKRTDSPRDKHYDFVQLNIPPREIYRRGLPLLARTVRYRTFSIPPKFYQLFDCFSSQRRWASGIFWPERPEKEFDV